MKLPKTLVWIGLVSLFAAFILSGCSTGNREISINLKEANLNEVIQNAAEVQDLPFQVNSVDMKDGLMRVFMSYRKEDGTELNGAYDITLKTEEGQLSAEIMNVDMDGLVLDQQILDQIADLIKRDFVNASSSIRGQVEFRSLQIGEDGLQMVLDITP